LANSIKRGGFFSTSSEARFELRLGLLRTCSPIDRPFNYLRRHSAVVMGGGEGGLGQ